MSLTKDSALIPEMDYTQLNKEPAVSLKHGTYTLYLRQFGLIGFVKVLSEVKTSFIIDQVIISDVLCSGDRKVGEMVYLKKTGNWDSAIQILAKFQNNCFSSKEALQRVIKAPFKKHFLEAFQTLPTQSYTHCNSQILNATTMLEEAASSSLRWGKQRVKFYQSHKWRVTINHQNIFVFTKRNGRQIILYK